MYGTVARTRVKPENRDKLRAVVARQLEAGGGIPGMVTSYVLHENDSDVSWLFAIFEDRASSCPTSARTATARGHTTRRPTRPTSCPTTASPWWSTSA